ncbi:MAG: gamma-glutamyltransferase [Gemmatimonadota bacterium]
MPEYPAAATSEGGMVVTGSPYATEAGVRMLEKGGNAVDAAVAAAFALAVAEPTQSGLGGRTQILIRSADGTVAGIDGTTQVPAGYDPASAPAGEHGHSAVAIPGTVAALTRALAEHGSLPLSLVIQPAADWARHGIALPEGEARRLDGVAGEIDPRSPLGRIFLSSEGTALPRGGLLVQPDLAEVMDAVGQGGAAAFYRGDIARRIVADMEANGGFLTLDDLASYRALDSEIGRGRFGDTELVGTYLPASGVTVIEILQILDRMDPPDGHALGDAALVEALLAGFEDRELAEPRPPGEAVSWLVSDSLALRRAGAATRDLQRRASRVASHGELEREAGVMSGIPSDGEHAFTTHVSVADTFGCVVALTQSLGPTLGARVVTPGLGFVYASTLGGYLAGGGPGYRPWSSQAPLVALRQGRPALVIGGAGARRILSAMVGTLTDVLGRAIRLDVALAEPRLHPTGGVVLVEGGWPGADALANLGFEVEPRERTYFARLNAVEILPDGTFRGVGDPRWSESAAGGPRR